MEYDNKILFYDCITGKEIALNEKMTCPHSLIPQQIEYLEKNNLFFVVAKFLRGLS